MLSLPSWINLTNTVPTAEEFNTTQGRGPPINVDRTTGVPYIVIGNLVVPLATGQFVNVKFFGAQGNAVTDDTTAVQAALTYANSIGGAVVFFPPGIYKVSSYLLISPKTTIQGSGETVSILRSSVAGGGGANAGESLRNGSIFYSTAPINSSTAVRINIRDIGLENTNGANNGSGYYDTGGTFIKLSNVRVDGFKYGLTFDQSELTDCHACCLENQSVGGLWLVNGADLTPGAATGFTNRFSLSRSQINQGGGSIGIIDDGGVTHSFVDNNYNGCLHHIRAAGAEGLKISGGEFESAAAANIKFDATTLAGGGVGGCSVVYIGGGAFIVPTAGQNCIIAFALGNIVFSSVFFGNTAVVKFNGTVNVNQIIAFNCFNGGGGATFDGYATNHFEVGYDGAAFAIRTNQPYIFNGNKVLGARGAAVANAAHSAAAPTKAEFDAFVDLFNTLKSRLEAATGHGLIA